MWFVVPFHWPEGIYGYRLDNRGLSARAWSANGPGRDLSDDILSFRMRGAGGYRHFSCPQSSSASRLMAGHWARQPAHDLRHLFDGAFGRAPSGRLLARVALRLACPFARAFSARTIPLSMGFSAPVTPGPMTLATHSPFSRSFPCGKKSAICPNMTGRGAR